MDRVIRAHSDSRYFCALFSSKCLPRLSDVFPDRVRMSTLKAHNCSDIRLSQRDWRDSLRVRRRLSAVAARKRSSRPRTIVWFCIIASRKRGQVFLFTWCFIKVWAAVSTSLWPSQCLIARLWFVACWRELGLNVGQQQTNRWLDNRSWGLRLHRGCDTSTIDEWKAWKPHNTSFFFLFFVCLLYAECYLFRRWFWRCCFNLSRCLPSLSSCLCDSQPVQGLYVCCMRDFPPPPPHPSKTKVQTACSQCEDRLREFLLL